MRPRPGSTPAGRRQAAGHPPGGTAGRPPRAVLDPAGPSPAALASAGLALAALALAALVLAATAAPALAGTSVSGFAEASGSSTLGSGRHAAGARLRLEGRASVGELLGAVSLEAARDWAVPGSGDVRLKELWAEWSRGPIDLRLGRQIIVWGQADGIRITDVVCPQDYSAAPSRRLDDVRKPVEAALLRIRGEVVDLELVWVPFFRAATLPSQGSPWFTGSPGGPGARGDRPARTLGSGGAGARLEGHFPGLDLAISAFRTRSEIPVAGPAPGGGAELSWPRLTVIGASASKPMGDLVWRLEAAWRAGERRQAVGSRRDPRVPGQPLRADSLKWLAGLDWSPGRDWTVSGQISGEELVDPPAGLADPRDPLMGTLSVEKKLLGQRLSVSNMIFADFRDRSFYDAFEVGFEIRDGLLASLGADLFGGRGGRFGALRDVSRAWVRLRWHF